MWHYAPRDGHASIAVLTFFPPAWGYPPCSIALLLMTALSNAFCGADDSVYLLRSQLISPYSIDSIVASRSSCVVVPLDDNAVALPLAMLRSVL